MATAASYSAGSMAASMPSRSALVSNRRSRSFSVAVRESSGKLPSDRREGVALRTTTALEVTGVVVAAMGVVDRATLTRPLSAPARTWAPIR